MPDLSNEKIFPGGIKVKALFTPNMKWRLVEEFGPNCFTETDDGRLLFSADYTDMENLVTWLMTFGAKVEVLEPEEVRDIIRRNAEEILKIYGGLITHNEEQGRFSVSQRIQFQLIVGCNLDRKSVV